MLRKTPWDEVADKFNTYKKDLWYGAADNIDAVWPVILSKVKENFPDPTGLRALDFGCGTGMFCRELKTLGFEVTGIDLSKEMIRIGEENLKNDIKLLVGDTSTAQKQDKLDLITSIMALQFISEEGLEPLLDSLKPDGHIVIANHNPKRLEERGIKETLYLTDTKIPVRIYGRNAIDYDKIFSKFGFSKTTESYISQSEEFVKKYNIKHLTKNPKYMILGYRKTN